MTNGINNFHIEEAFKNIGDNDINNNFAGVFPSNHMNKFIADHKLMISEKKKENFHLLLQTLTARAGAVHIGGVYLTLNQKLTYVSLIILDVMG